MKTIIKIEPEWNNAHCSIADAEEVLPGWAELPEALKSVWEEHGPFVAIVANEGVITNMVATEEILGKTVDQAQTEKLAELRASCNETIVNGCDVTLSSTSGHISLTNEDQINLTNVAASIEAGMTEYLYHLDGQLCTMFSAADILVMAKAATEHKLYHTTYYNHLAAWVRRCETVKDVEAIAYGSELPEDLAANMAAILAAAQADKA